MKCLYFEAIGAVWNVGVLIFTVAIAPSKEVRQSLSLLTSDEERMAENRTI